MNSLEERGIDAFDIFESQPDETLEQLIQALFGSLEHDEDRIARIRAVLEKVSADKIGLRRYNTNKKKAEAKFAS